MKPQLCLACACRAAGAAIMLGGSSPLLAHEPTSRALHAQVWHFEVQLDGRRIGTHEFTVSGDGDEVEVTGHANFRLSALFLPLFRYEHDDHERWRSGCLWEIDARTRENGQVSIVHGQAAQDAFIVQGPRASATLHGCIRTFAYWDQASLLQQSRLLNAQTGEYEAVDVRHENSAPGDVSRQHYSISSGHYRIDLWYAATGEWLGLESHTPDGHTLHYEARR